MAPNGYTPNGVQHQTSYRIKNTQTISPINQNNNPFDSDARNSNLDATADLLIRKLPRHTTLESLRTMLLFSKDCLSAEFVSINFPEDQGYLAAIARFSTFSAAQEVRTHLNGKHNNPDEFPLHVELIRHSPGGSSGTRRNNDMPFNRANSSSSTGSSSGQGRHSSRFNSTFQAMDRIHSSNGPLTNGGSFSSAERPDLVSPLSSIFSPQSPLGQAPGDHQRVSGKSVIGEDGIDDEPGDLLRDPVAYAARNDATGQPSRPPTNHQLPMNQFANLSLTTTGGQSYSNGYTRTAPPMQSPSSASPHMTFGNQGPNAPYQMPNQTHQRRTLPPCNPADQNKPCNTLYVGNLPMDTSEDELKNLFSKQRGFRRLCFRTKHNGPMCFVEFEDISFATKVLNSLYGVNLHNSCKGGIRLSYSKNPLGQRSVPPGEVDPRMPLTPTGPPPGMNGLGVVPFSTANGPPPGLAAPPGLNPSVNGMNGLMGPAGVSNFGMDMSMGAGNFRGGQMNGMAAGWNGHGGQYAEFMYGR